MPTKVIMPQLGESVVEGTVTKWLKGEGDQIDEFEPLLEVNTDKVDTEIPSPAGGIVLRILVPEDTTVKAGTTLAWIGETDESIPEEEVAPEAEGLAEAPAPHAAPDAAEPVAMAPAAVPLAAATLGAGQDRELGFISPVVARIASKHAVDLNLVTGTGRGGRITKKDVLAYLDTRAEAPQVEQALAWETPVEGDLFKPTELLFGDDAAPESVPPQAVTARPGQVIPHSPVRRAIAEHMVRSVRTSPHVTTVMEVDLSRVIAHRASNKETFTGKGVNLTFTAYFIAASVAALRAHPIVNSSWSDEGVMVHPAINIGVATSLGEQGLIVPVIKNADGLSLLGIARAVNDLAGRARSRKLQPDDVQGGTFTITNHGVSGSLFATPIINQPQCAILGVGVVQKRAVVVNDAIAIRPMVYLSLTFDHRILDGAIGDTFLASLVEYLQNWN